MSYKQAVFANQEIYHVVNTGMEKKITFIDKKDLERFVQTLDYYRFKNPQVRFSFRKRKAYKQAKNSPVVEIFVFCLMPNQFHLLLKQLEEGGVSNFISRLANSYTKYFNTKYKRLGPLFQGTFKAVRIENDEQLLHTSRYIHLKPLTESAVRDLKKFPFSSYLEYLGLEDGFCQKEEVLSHFNSPQDYEKFVLDQADYQKSKLNFLE